MAKTQENGRLGFTNTQGEWVIPLQFEDTASFDVDTGSAVFSPEDGKWGCVDRDGQVRIEPVYDDIEPYGFTQALEVVLEGRRGYINLQGGWIGDFLVP